MKIVNLTPHEIVVIQEEQGNVIYTPIPASGALARCKQETRMCTPIITEVGASIPCGINSYGEIEGLPDRKEGTWYITSALVAQAAWALGRSFSHCNMRCCALMRY